MIKKHFVPCDRSSGWWQLWEMFYVKHGGGWGGVACVRLVMTTSICHHFSHGNSDTEGQMQGANTDWSRHVIVRILSSVHILNVQLRDYNDLEKTNTLEQLDGRK